MFENKMIIKIICG